MSRTGGDITTWLNGLSLAQYASTFVAQDVDFDVLPALTDADLKELGVSSLGHRRKILFAITRELTPRREDDAPARPIEGLSHSAEDSFSEPLGAYAAVRADLGGERRQLTVVFIDVVDSTRMSVGLDPEDARRLIAGFQRTASNAILRFGGSPAQFMGDGVMAFFGDPVAHEDDAVRAVRTAMTLLSDVEKLPSVSGWRMEIRIGIATGSVVVGEIASGGLGQERAAIGATTNLAARLQSVGEAGGITVCPLTRRLCEGLFRFDEGSEHALKGFDRPVRCFGAIAETGADRFSARELGRTHRLIGRESELAVLAASLRSAKEGHGSAVVVRADAGIGKSKLAATLLAEARQELEVLSFYCATHTSDSPLRPVVETLRSVCGLSIGMLAQDCIATLRASFESREYYPSDVDLELLGGLLRHNGGSDANGSDSPQETRTARLRAIVDLIIGVARNKGLLVLFEDVHWADRSSLELLDALCTRLAASRVLVVATARPEFEHVWPDDIPITTLSLRSLSRDAARELVKAKVGNATLDENVVEQILDRSDGVPLFLEEMTSLLLDYVSCSPEVEPGAEESLGILKSVPVTLNGLLAARLDKLVSSRRIAQVGAVIGRRFDAEVLALVTNLSAAELQAPLARLVESGLVARESRNRPSYLFKHSLVQDAAYATLLREDRSDLHVRIARALDRLFPELQASQPELLAHHLEQGQLYDEASRLYAKAGEAALRTSAVHEAMGHFANALRTMGFLPRDEKSDARECRLQMYLGLASNSAKGYAYPATMRALERARDLAKITGDRLVSEVTASSLFTVVWNQATYDRALALASEHLSSLAHSDGRNTYSVAHRLMACALGTMGRFGDSLEHAEKSFSYYNAESDTGFALTSVHNQGVAAMTWLAHSLWHRGRNERALDLEQRARQHATAVRHANSIGYALWFCGALSAHRRRAFAEAEDFARRLIEFGGRGRLPTWQSLPLAHIGRALIERGAIEEGVEHIRETMRFIERLGSRYGKPLWLSMLAEGAIAANRPEQALEHLDRALEIAEENVEHWWTAEILRIRGMAMLSTAGSDAIECASAAFQRAVDIAGKQGSITLQLRSAVQLAECLQRLRGHRHAHDWLCNFRSIAAEVDETLPERIALQSSVERLSRQPSR